MSIEQQSINMDMRTNADRAACAGRVLGAEETYSQSLDEDEPGTALVDLLADLMHWYACQDFGSSFDALVRIAKIHFEEELSAEMEEAETAPDDPWVENPNHPIIDWQAEVAADDTRLGYWDWLAREEGDDAEKEDDLWIG